MRALQDDFQALADLDALLGDDPDDMWASAVYDVSDTRAALQPDPAEAPLVIRDSYASVPDW